MQNYINPHVYGDHKHEGYTSFDSTLNLKTAINNSILALHTKLSCHHD